MPVRENARFFSSAACDDEPQKTRIGPAKHAKGREKKKKLVRIAVVPRSFLGDQLALGVHPRDAGDGIPPFLHFWRFWRIISQPG